MDIDIKLILKNKVLLIYGFLVMGLIVGGGWYLYDKIFVAIDAMSNMSSKEDELRDLTDRVLKLDGIDVDVYETRNTEMLTKVLPDNVDLSLTLGAMVTMAKDAEFTVDKGRIVDSGQEGSLQERKIEIEFIGKDENIKKLVERMMKVKPLMDIVSMDVTYEDPLNAKYKISVVTYGWQAMQDKTDVMSNLSVIENQNKYEQLFKDIESWEEITPSLDFVFECDPERDPFSFGGCDNYNNLNKENIVSSEEVVIENVDANEASLE